MEKTIELDRKLFRKKFENYLDNFYRKLSEYISDPNEENIHDIRTSIRRLEAVYRVSPKKVRKCRQIRNYVKQAKKLFKLNTKIRDFDIICKNMEAKYPNKTLDLVSNLKKSRIEQIQKANKLAQKTYRLPIPQIPKPIINEIKLKKRYSNILNEIELEIQKNTIIVLGDDKKLEELHMLRKDFKKLRYAIELIAKKKRIRGIKSLKNLQDMLGEIHDHDMILEYLNTESNSKYKEIIEIEIQDRSKKYQEFITFLKNSSDK